MWLFQLISLGLQGVGLATSLLVPVIGPPLGASIGSVGTIVGIVSLGLNYNMKFPIAYWCRQYFKFYNLYCVTNESV